jgi:hypothetical protein
MPEEIATEATLLKLIESVDELTESVKSIHKILKDVWDDDRHYLRVHQTVSTQAL